MTLEEKNIESDERIDRYLRDQLDATERAAFEQEVDNNLELRERLVATAMLVKGISHAGMQREGQAQLDTIRQMSRDEFLGITQGKKRRNPIWAAMKWAASIAAIAFVAYGVYTFRPSTSTQNLEMAEEAAVDSVDVQDVIPKPAEPTLADLANEYNQPFDNEPEEFASIRQQIKKGTSEDMMAVVYDIDKVEWPTARHGSKGADDDEEIKNTTDNFNDCTHWYMALAYLKANDKESATKELNELIEEGHNDILIERANDLLKKLKK